MPKDIESQVEVCPAFDLDAREKQMCALAVSLAEKQLREGTASSQVITHYLKLAASTAKLEKEILVSQRDLYKAKAEAIVSQREDKELMQQAMDAMRTYTGNRNE